MSVPLRTQRLILRRWRAEDAAPFAALNADPEVMRFFPKRLDPDESDAMIARCDQRWEADGIGFAAVEHAGTGALLGMAGLSRVRFEAPVAGAVEIGWRFARSAWGHGYATEAARSWLAHGFDALGLPEIVSFAVPANAASIAVMRRIGMTRNPARDFDHPALPEGSPLQRHVVYAIAAPRPA